MKIALAQIRPEKGAIEQNIKGHLRLIELAKANQADAIFFPELSLTSYEPKLVKQLALRLDDSRLDVFQNVADKNALLIGLGIPLQLETGIQIALIAFRKDLPRLAYAKQRLHPDEFPYFVEGEEQVYFDILKERLAPAICYESLLPLHAEKVVKNKATIYIASVAKSQEGMDKAKGYYSILAKEYAMPVLLANSIGPCDDFESAGASSAWDKTGRLLGQMEEEKEGVLVFDSQTQRIVKYLL